MSARRIKGIIWDLDGTLIDSDLYLVANYVHMYSKFRPGYFPHLRQILTFSGPSVEETLESQFPDVPEKVRTEEFVRYSLSKETSFLTLYPGEIECLEAVVKAGIKQTIFTNKKTVSAKNCLDGMNLTKYFDGVVALDDVKNPKPDPEGVYKCLKMMGTSPEETIIIGDSITDLQAAYNTGCLSGLVTWSLKGKPNFRRDYEFDTMDDIKRFVTDGEHESD